MKKIIRGIHKFHDEVFPRYQGLFHDLADGQHPRALFVTCADSRVLPSLFTQTEPGELFLCRNAGNMIPPHGTQSGGVTATIEYAVMALKVPHVVVCGHSDCGAMRALLHPEKTEGMPNVQAWLNHGELARQIVAEMHPDLSEAEKVDLLIKENVVAQLDHLKTHPPVATGLRRGTLQVHGWVYHIASGEMEAWDQEKRVFRPIEELYQPLIEEPDGAPAMAMSVDSTIVD